MPLVRPRARRRGPPGGAVRVRGMSGDDAATGGDAAVAPGDGTGVADGLVLAALELAVAVARVSTQLRPPVTVPRGLRSLTRFTKLPPSARPAVRRALEEDDEFRARVAAAADLVEIPRAAWLFLHRPDGWLAEIDLLAEAAAGADADAEAGRADRALRRRLDGAQDRIARLDEALLAARSEVARAVEELAAERRARRDAEDRLAALGRRAASAEAERDASRRRAEVAAARMEELEQRLARGVETPAAVEALASERAGRIDAEARADAGASQLATVRAIVADATASAGALATSLGRASAALGPPAPPVASLSGDDGVLGSVAAGGPGPASTGRPTPPRAARARSRSAPARQPQRLPPAVFDDSAEAAEHLVRQPGMLVLVDGYNVTFAAWRDLPIATQRVRLIDACAELAARAPAELLIVFDGTEEPGDLAPAAVRPGVRWRFSPHGVEADDVLLDLVDELDPGRPVTVASSDRRVRDGARGRGANAISTPQLLRALRRDSPA